MSPMNPVFLKSKKENKTKETRWEGANVCTALTGKQGWLHFSSANKKGRGIEITSKLKLLPLKGYCHSTSLNRPSIPDSGPFILFTISKEKVDTMTAPVLRLIAEGRRSLDEVGIELIS